MTVGDTRITWLPDGVGEFSPVMFFPQSDEKGWEKHSQWLDGNKCCPMGLGAVLVQTSTHTVLVDTGYGAHEHDSPLGKTTGGALMTSLDRAKVTPTDVDAVIYTHLHLD